MWDLSWPLLIKTFLESIELRATMGEIFKDLSVDHEASVEHVIPMGTWTSRTLIGLLGNPFSVPL